MESTGCYHINLFSFLTSQGVHAVVINPLLIANFAKRSLKKTKTDKKDARTIAKFLRENREEIFQLSVSHLITATKVEIKRVLRMIFPELRQKGGVRNFLYLSIRSNYY